MVILAVIVVFILLYISLPLIYPFIFGLIFAYLFNPLVSFLERKARFPRWLSVILVILLFLALIATLITLIVIEIVSEIDKLQEHMPAYFEQMTKQIESFILNDVVAFYDQFTAFYSSLEPEVQYNIEAYIREFTASLTDSINVGIRHLLDGVLAFIGAIPMIATAFIISLLASFFLSKDWPRWRETLLSIVPERIHRSGGAVILDLKGALFGFVKAQLTLISITFVIVLIGFLIMRIEYALTIAIFIAIVDLLPYLGTGLVFIPWIIYSFINGDYAMVIGLSILYGIVVIQRQMMEPKILGDNVGLDPLVTLFALFVGFQIFGLIGLILGPVIMVILGALHRAGVFKETWSFIKGGPLR